MRCWLDLGDFVGYKLEIPFQLTSVMIAEIKTKKKQ